MVPETCWGGTEHSMSEVRLSDCAQGCNVYRCSYCKQEYVLHNIMYHCEQKVEAL